MVCLADLEMSPCLPALDRLRWEGRTHPHALPCSPCSCLLIVELSTDSCNSGAVCCLCSGGVAGELFNERDLQGVAVGWAGDMGFQNRVEPLASAIDKAAARAGPRNARLIEQYRAAMRREDEHRDGPHAVRWDGEGAAGPPGMLLRSRRRGICRWRVCVAPILVLGRVLWWC